MNNSLYTPYVGVWEQGSRQEYHPWLRSKARRSLERTRTHRAEGGGVVVGVVMQRSVCLCGEESPSVALGKKQRAVCVFICLGGRVRMFTCDE